MIEYRLLTSPHQAHKQLMELWQQYAKPHSMRGGQAIVCWETRNPKLRELMRGALHATLRQIASEVWFTNHQTGTRFRYTLTAWKEFFRQEFLDAGISTEAISDDRYALFLLQVTAFAVVELNMELQEPEEE